MNDKNHRENVLESLKLMLGEEVTKSLCEQMGGKAWEIPKGFQGKKKPYNRGDKIRSIFCNAIGVEEANKVFNQFSGCKIYIPKNYMADIKKRNFEIVNLYNDGASIHDLVGLFGLSDRRIQKILKTTDMTKDIQIKIN